MATYILSPGAWLSGSLNPPISVKSGLNPPIGQASLNPPISGKSTLNPPISGKSPLNPPISQHRRTADLSEPGQRGTLEAAASVLTQAVPWRSSDAPWTYDGAPATLLSQALTHMRTAVMRPSDPKLDPLPGKKLRARADASQFDEREALWRWGSEFRQQAVLADLAWRFRVCDRVLEAAWPTGPFSAKFFSSVDLRVFAPGGALAGAEAPFEWLGKQVDKVLRAAAEREERLPEILVQCDDLWSFFQTVTGIDADSHPLVFEVLHLAWQWAEPLVMALKNDVAMHRPNRCSSRVMPVIPTPSHGSLPSGHATMAALTSQLLAALLYDQPGDKRPENLDRLARRIAFNRVVAGVHFPVDSAAGYALGLQLAEHFIGLATGKRPPATYKFDPTKHQELREIGTRPLLGKPADKPPTSTILSKLWAAAFRQRRLREGHPLDDRSRKGRP